MGRVKDKREWTRSDKSQARGGTEGSQSRDEGGFTMGEVVIS